MERMEFHWFIIINDPQVKHNIFCKYWNETVKISMDPFDIKITSIHVHLHVAYQELLQASKGKHN